MRTRTVEALKRAEGNQCHAASLLGIHRNTLSRHLEDLELKQLPAEIRRQKRDQLALNFPARRVQRSGFQNKPLRAQPAPRRASGDRISA